MRTMLTVEGQFAIEDAARAMALLDWFKTAPPTGVRFHSCKSKKWLRRRNKAYTRWNKEAMDDALSSASYYAEAFEKLFSPYPFL